MEAIYKYELDLDKATRLEMPPGARVLSVQSQHGKPVMWCIVNLDSKQLQERRFVLVGTGWKVEGLSGGTYHGTFQDGPFVWHVFEDLDH